MSLVGNACFLGHESHDFDRILRFVKARIVSRN